MLSQATKSMFLTVSRKLPCCLQEVFLQLILRSRPDFRDESCLTFKSKKNKNVQDKVVAYRSNARSAGIN